MRLREHWVLVTAAVCLLLIALIGGTNYWLHVKDYESTDDALTAGRSFFPFPGIRAKARSPAS